MQYKGKELIEANGADYPLTNTPHKMLVWDFEQEKPFERDVLGFWSGCWEVASLSCEKRLYPYNHAAEIPTEPDPTDTETRLTNRELAKWLIEGNGEWLDDCDYVHTTQEYELKEADYKVEDYVKIRKWSDAEWHEPTHEYIEEELANIGVPGEFEAYHKADADAVMDAMEQRVAELVAENKLKAEDVERLNEKLRIKCDEIAELKKQECRWFGIVRDLVVVLGNDPYMVWTAIDSRLKIMCDPDEIERFEKLNDSILKRTKVITPDEWNRELPTAPKEEK